jgi:ABC-type spermidine/putrescine transport system permease subunit II
VTGVVSLVLAVLVIFAPLALPLGLVAIVLGAVGMSRASRGEADNRGQAVAGLVTGALSIVVAIVIGIGFVSFFTEHQGDLRRFGTCMSSADNDRERAPCVRELGNRLDE